MRYLLAVQIFSEEEPLTFCFYAIVGKSASRIAWIFSTLVIRKFAVSSLQGSLTGSGIDRPAEWNRFSPPRWSRIATESADKLLGFPLQ